MKISIITASYNYAQYIEKMIESVLSQSYKNWELIIVDDGSTDNSIEIIKKYCEKYKNIFLYTHEKNQNKGLAKTLQLGLSKCNTEWCCFLEADDTFASNYLEEKIKIIKNYKNVNFIFNNVNMITDNQELKDFFENYLLFLKNEYTKNKNPDKLIKLIKNKIVQNVIPSFSVVMLKKDLLIGCDFNSPVPAYLDFYLWCQIAKYAQFYFIDKKLTNWLCHENSFLTKHIDVDSRIKFYYKLYLYQGFDFFVLKKMLRIVFSNIFRISVSFKKRRILYMGKKITF